MTVRRFGSGHISSDIELTKHTQLKRFYTAPPGGYSRIRAYWGRAASQCMFFGIFVLNRKRFYQFCLNQGIDFINFCLKQGIFSWTINSLRDSVDQAVNSFVIAKIMD